jgi:hypothetical protein
MKQLIRLSVLFLLLLPLLAACSGGQSETVSNPAEPVVQIYYPSG